MQKLTSYILVFYLESHKKDTAISYAFKEFEKWNFGSLKMNEGYFIEGKTYNEIIAKFNKELAEWSISIRFIFCWNTSRYGWIG
ncbi:hypothetical protein [Lacinutrix undariae]